MAVSIFNINKKKLLLNLSDTNCLQRRAWCPKSIVSSNIAEQFLVLKIWLNLLNTVKFLSSTCFYICFTRYIICIICMLVCWPVCMSLCRSVSMAVKLQALVYDILPSTTAVFSYAIGSRKLSANERFFCWRSDSSKCVTNNSNYIRRLFHNWPCCLRQLK